MGFFKYSVKVAEKVGKAQAYDVDASYKDLTQVCRAIRSLPVKKAYSVLEAAIEGKHAIPYYKFSKGMGHRSELGGKKGRYPKKECKIVLASLKNAAANAVHNGLEEGSLVVRHAAAYKQTTYKRHRTFFVGSVTLGYGKHAVWADYVTARIEIVVSGKQGAEKEGKAKGPAASEAGKKGKGAEGKEHGARAETKAAKPEGEKGNGKAEGKTATEAGKEPEEKAAKAKAPAEGAKAPKADAEKKPASAAAEKK